MGSKGGIPPNYIHRSRLGPGIGHPDPFTPGLRPLHDAFTPYNVLPPTEVMEQKLDAQFLEVRELAIENKRLAATHGTLRQDIAAAENELQMLHAHMSAVESEREKERKSLLDRIAKIEADLQAAEPLKLELQKARVDAQELLASRQELVSKVQDLTQNLQMAHEDMQQFPNLISELENLRQEYQHCRATYDYEKNLSNDHRNSLQEMEKSCLTMAREVEKLHAELMIATKSNVTGVPYNVTTGFNNSTGYDSVGENVYNNHGLQQGHSPRLQGGSGDGGGSALAIARAIGTAPTSTLTVTPTYAPTAAPASASLTGAPAVANAGTPHVDKARPGYDAPRGPDFNPQPESNYKTQRGPSCIAQSGTGGPGYSADKQQSGPVNDVQKDHFVAGYDAQGAVGGRLGYDAQGAPNRPGYNAQGGAIYDGHHGPCLNPPGGTSYYDAPRGAGYGERGTGYRGAK